MPTDAQVHDLAWVFVTAIGYFGLYVIIMLGIVVWAILWQVNCILREIVLEARERRKK
jgi:hypothetical protein